MSFYNLEPVDQYPQCAEKEDGDQNQLDSKMANPLLAVIEMLFIKAGEFK